MRILLRAHKNPFRVASAFRTLSGDLIGGNVGNLVFSQAVCRLLSTSESQIDTSKLRGLSPNQVNAKYDQVVIPLANAFRPSFADELAELTNLIACLDIPVVVVGCGVQAPLSGQVAPSSLDETVAGFVSVVLEHSATIGVRGEITAAYLKRLGFGDDAVDVVGCPSMFMYGPQLSLTQTGRGITRESRVSLNVSPYRPEMAAVCLDHADRYPNLVYTAQDRTTLELMITGEWDSRVRRPPGSLTSLEHPLFRQNRVRFCLDPTTWMEHLRSFEFSFGTRIHGNITALLAGVPAVVLAHDSRTLELAQYHQIPHRALSRDHANMDAVELFSHADWTQTVSGHAERWSRMATFLERNGLRHIDQPGQALGGFDDRLGRTHFPTPIQVGGTWLSRREATLRRWMKATLARTDHTTEEG
ncbi:MAG: polysaccharide pyruvyl transferase family protein [Propionibacteriaceae bacterium]|jgi:hypothetical protein|nr:polysaccharide pyruvyl transferase family protein [Propionibacteriaceae bacterium]